MRGYVTKKGTRWYAVIYDGVDPTTGKEKRRWIKAGTRKGDAEKIVTDMVKRRQAGETVSVDKTTLGAYLTERWMPIQQSKIRTSTCDSYRRNIDLHVLPVLGNCPLDKLTADDLDLLYATLLKKGQKGNRTGGLAPKTVRNIHLMLNKALADAHRKGLVARNVATMADPPSATAKRSGDIKAWDAAQLRTFLKATGSIRLYPAFHLASHTGMRRGEILGLRWGDLDLKAGRLAVRQALVSVAYEVHLSDVKTSAGRRTIDLDDGTVAVLNAWRTTRTAEAGGSAPLDSDHVFTKVDGNWLHPDLVSQTFDSAVARLEVPRISLHDLRHTHATLLLRAGVPVKVVSERLGHANVAFTMSVYQHVLPGMQAEAAATFAGLLDDDLVDNEPALTARPRIWMTSLMTTGGHSVCCPRPAWADLIASNAERGTRMQHPTSKHGNPGLPSLAGEHVGPWHSLQRVPTEPIGGVAAVDECPDLTGPNMDTRRVSSSRMSVGVDLAQFDALAREMVELSAG